MNTNNAPRLLVTHETLGFTKDSITYCFSNKPYLVNIKKLKAVKKPLLHTNIPILDNYKTNPTSDFWDKFPSSPLPDSVHTPINVKKFEDLYNERKNKFSASQHKNILYVINNLKHGADNLANQDILPALELHNKSSLLKPEE